MESKSSNNYEERSLMSVLFESKLNTAFFSAMIACLIVYLAQIIICYTNYHVVPIYYDFIRFKTHCSASWEYFLFLIVSISLSIALSAFGAIKSIFQQKKLQKKFQRHPFEG